jgi:adenylate cyclase
VAPLTAVPRKNRRRRLALAAASVVGAILVALLGWVLICASQGGTAEEKVRPRFGWLPMVFGDFLGRFSYDVLFLLREPREIPPGRIVYLDEKSAAKLGQKGGVWDRSLHADLVRRLTRDGARAVFFDVVFPDASADPAVDEDFAAAIAENGRVYLGATLELDYGAQALQERTGPPTPVLRKAAAGWGLITFRPIDADYGVRRIYTGLELSPSATWRAAIKLGAPLPDSAENRAVERWLNYYGPPNSFPNVSFDRALSLDELPPDFFRDQLVFIGGRSTLGTLNLGKDDFRTPFGWFGGQFAKGVELHLTTLLNLLRGDWLTRLDPTWELWLVIVWGLLLGGGLPWLRPIAAAVVTGFAVLALICAAVLLQSRSHVWFVWAVPALVQAPVALVWAVGTRYFIEERRRRALREAFACYLSPQMADRISEADFDLKPGGAVVNATVIFTDLEDYSGLCQRLDNPLHVSQVLTTYFTHTTGHILDNDGTIIKFMGDAVQAAWNAPLPDTDHVRKAVRAAWNLHQASLIECNGHPLRTRIGVNTGDLLAGNLGSAQRFDYTVTGDAVNFASRLEGLNKYLGTDILISDTVQAALDGEFATRCVGEFLVAGRLKPSVVHEVLGPAKDKARPWVETFAAGLKAFQRGDLDAAERGMNETVTLRSERDGPAHFYLERIASLRSNGVPSDWRGVVEFLAK